MKVASVKNAIQGGGRNAMKARDVASGFESPTGTWDVLYMASTTPKVCDMCIFQKRCARQSKAACPTK